MFYVVFVILIIFSVFQLLSPIAPWLGLDKFIEVCDHDSRLLHYNIGRFNLRNYQRSSLVALVYSVGGLHLPAAGRIKHDPNTAENQLAPYEWVHNEKVYCAYFDTEQGKLFIIGYFTLIVVCLGTILTKGLWYKEPLLVVIAYWVFLYITFFVYSNPYAGPHFASELQAPLWAFFALVLYRKNFKELTFFFLCLFLAIVSWNNVSVMQFFKWYYE